MGRPYGSRFPCVSLSVRRRFKRVLISVQIRKLNHGDRFAGKIDPMHVRLTRKLADALNGFDLREFVVGEVLDLPDQFARMLVAENWAEAVMLGRDAAADRVRPLKRN